MSLSGFLQWAYDRGIQFQPSVEVRASDLGGVGIFAKTAIAENSVMLKVPRSCVYDLKNLLILAETIKTNDQSQVASSVLNATLHAGGHDSESIIVRSFLWGITMLREMNKPIQLSGVEQIAEYLDVLLNTPILDFDDAVNASTDYTIRELVREKARVKRDYERLINELPEAKSLMDFAQAFQLHQAVKSRVLEIPQAETGATEYDYSTSISLVPVLDFANHDHENNAVFDVDPASDNVILRLINDVRDGDEITISYDPENSVNKFLTTYGFIPRGPYTITVSIPNFDTIIAGICGQKEDYIRIGKWLEVCPEITVIADGKGTVSLDTEKLRLPLLLISGLTYYQDWASETTDISEEFGTASREETAEIITELKRRENDALTIRALHTAFGVTWHNSYISLPHILQQTGALIELERAALVARTVEAITRIASRPRPVDVQIPSFTKGVPSPIEQYLTTKNFVLDAMFGMSSDEIQQAVESTIQKLSKRSA